MKQTQLFVLSLLLIVIASCKEDRKVEDVQATIETGTSTFYLIRHAEKDRSDDQDPDPELTQRGLGRAMHWAEILKDTELDAIYSTDYQRTSMTAAPTSVKQNIDVQYYDPQTMDIDQFKSDNLNKNVLVVGHSNTTPSFANLLLGEDKYYQMDDTDNGSLYIVQIVNGEATSQKLYFNCNCPKRE
ncbi:histidine phosphatase family protein [Flavobacteriaceae bacterium TP-CH-4]|uniref:Histidine phosphatase family protein n=1 Tax=Pelagihabitans pacificus TaxID=2696054 RepID=A0A967ATT7_9FLAO|nr:histidine phosphatase family protein [Pelagihabitans pacificus]NHF59285.1 histidine phosphatase family protein [Pelagihabitans pacificus]